MAHADPPSVPSAQGSGPQDLVPARTSPVPSPTSSPAVNPPRVALLGATALLSGFVFLQAPSLWDEWQGLRRDWEATRLTQPIGYIGISPSPSYARPPEPWLVERDDAFLIWGGWHRDAGHTWFRIGRDDLDLRLLGRPLGRDVVRAIDRPLAEIGGGMLWERLQHDTPVVSVDLGGTSTAYPILLLSKVEVVNDTVGNRPVLVVSTPFRAAEETVDVYDPMLAGTRVLLGSSGLFYDPARRLPLLYDRDTESLWLVDDHVLRCVTGARKGTTMPHLGQGRPIAWADWVDQHPRGRLLVGADREAPPEIPEVTAQVLPAG